MVDESRRGGGAERYDVDPAELFFDLVFVFAVSQLAEHLLEHLTWRGAGETAVLLVAVFGVWYYTSWSATLLGVARSRTLLLVLSVTLLGLFLNASITHAFEGSGWGFALPLLLAQLGGCLWTVVNIRSGVWADHYRRTFVWLLLSAPLWLVGAAVDPDQRLAWWGAAAAVDLTGTWLAHPVPGRRLQSENTGLAEGPHMLERCRLFLIVALGEAILTTGASIATAPWSLATLLMGTAAAICSIALWFLIFGTADRLVLRYVEDTSDPTRATRMAGNAASAMVAGLIMVAVANELVIAHPHEPASATLNTLLFGGASVVLAAQTWFLRPVLNQPQRHRQLGVAGLLLLGVTTGFGAPAYLALVLAAAALSGLALWTARSTAPNQ